MQNLKNILRYLINQLVFFTGVIYFLITGKNLKKLHTTMISLFCFDGGRTLEFYSNLYKLINPPYPIENTSGIFGKLDQNQLNKIQNDLLLKGFSISEVVVPEEICQKLESLMFITLSYPMRTSPDKPHPAPCIFDSKNLVSSRYGFNSDELAQSEIVQEIMADESLLAIANNYFGSKPILDSVQMSICTDFSKDPNPDAAQMYHFDMDRLKWIKYFIYLSDVDENSGPHVYIKGTHKIDGIPSDLRKRGYARIHDEEVAKFFQIDRLETFKNRKGTLFVEDTRGLHKGTVLKKGQRLMFQGQYNQSLIGDSILNKHCIKELKSEKLKKMLIKYPEVFQNFIIVQG